jgi:hypothetical protein
VEQFSQMLLCIFQFVSGHMKGDAKRVFVITLSVRRDRGASCRTQRSFPETVFY